MKNHYNILGVPEDASYEQIKQAYRKLSVKFHPDKNDGDEYFGEMLKQINEAYQILGNEARRKEYDLARNESQAKSSKDYTQPKDVKKTRASRPNPSRSVWDGVKKWRRRRNYLILFNVLLLTWLWLQPPSADADSNVQNPTVRTSKRHNKKPKKKKAKVRQVQPTVQQEDSSDLLIDTLSIDTIKVNTAPNLKIVDTLYL